MKCSFNKRLYTIEVDDVCPAGLCDVPTSTSLNIRLYIKLNTQDGLETCIHEALHAESPQMKEEKVEQIAKDVARFLWKLGYRCKNGKRENKTSSKK